jgi:cytidylate kinase
MSYRVISVSGPDGALMREVAKAVAEALGFALVDEEIVQRVAATSGLEPGVVADAEKRRSFMARMFAGIGSSGSAASLTPFAGGLPVLLDDDRPGPAEVRDLIRTAIEETATQGSMVIVAHAASHALASQPDVLRALVTASLPVRLARVAAESGLDEQGAARAIDRSDASRASYLDRFYGTKSELPTHYDIVVNTDRLPPADAAALVVLAAAR